MSSRNMIRKPVLSASLNVATGQNPVATNAYTEFLASLSEPVSAVEIWNSSGKILTLALGAAGQEVDQEYTILPGGTVEALPIPIAKGSRIALKAVDATTTTGYIIMNFFG